MREAVHTLGEGAQMVGISTRPERAPRGAAVLFWNAGLLHRIGPNRLWVDASRRLARLGFPSLRFDLTGLGDSAVRRSPQTEDERALDDVRQAIAFACRELEVEEVILVGLCSGADQAHPAALADPRVRGVVSLDGIGYRTLGFRLRHLRARLLRGSLPRRVVRRVRRLLAPASEEPVETFERSFPPRERYETELQTLVDRGTRLLVIHTGGFSDGYYNHAAQFWAAFPRLEPRDRVRVEYLERADHTFTLSENRDQLLSLLDEWADGSFPAPPPSSVDREPRFGG